jgi:FkbM family methyltransferase
VSPLRSNILKRIARKLILVYLFPLRFKTSIFHQVKGIFFLDPTEHLYRTTKHIDSLANAGEQVMIDVGAAFGSVALYFSERYNDLKIYCVEANPEILPRLKETISHRKKIELKNMALGSIPGESYLHITANQLSSSLNELNTTEISDLPQDHQSWLEEVKRVKVQVSTLDAEFKNESTVLLLKLDTQGTELDILKGGVELLKRTRFVLAELNNHHLYKDACQYYEVDEFLRNHSFRLVDLVVTYHTNEEVQEYDALYENTNF